MAVFIKATGKDPCPVTALGSYVLLQGTSVGLFFCFADGTPPTKVQFVTRVRGTLSQGWFDMSGYSDHSFCIGAAMAAANAELPESVIQFLGC